MRNVAKAADEESYNKALRHLRESDSWMRNKKLYGQYLAVTKGGKQSARQLLEAVRYRFL